MTLSPPTNPTSTVTVGGHKYRVNSSATEEQLARLAARVDERLLALPLSQRGDPKSLVLIALGLAHDLEREQQLRAAERLQTEDRVRTLIARVDDALGYVDLNGDPLQTPEPSPLAKPTDVTPPIAVTVAEPALVRAAAAAQGKGAKRGSPDTTAR